VLQKLERDLVARKSLKKKSSKAIEVEHITNRDVIKATENCENEESGAIYVVARVVESRL